MDSIRSIAEGNITKKKKVKLVKQGEERPTVEGRAGSGRVVEKRNASCREQMEKKKKTERRKLRTRSKLY